MSDYEVTLVNDNSMRCLLSKKIVTDNAIVSVLYLAVNIARYCS